MSNRRKIGKRGCGPKHNHGPDGEVGFAEIRFVVDEEGTVTADLCYDVPTVLLDELVIALKDLQTKALLDREVA